MKDFITFLKKSPTSIQTIQTMKDILESYSYIELHEYEKWNVEKGKNYYIIRNDSSIISFQIPKTINHYAYHIVASHSDSPTFKLKHQFVIEDASYTKLNIEGYGGMIVSTWLDKPLSLAGRIFLEDGTKEYIHIDKDILIIPNSAIHMNRELNNGYIYNKQIDLLPILGDKSILDDMNHTDNPIISHDLYLYNRQEPTCIGNLISSARLDDLQCVYASLNGYIDACNNNSINVLAVFDHEEIGSKGNNGASSNFLNQILERINICLGYTYADYQCALSQSFMISADNAHALDPHHKEYMDQNNTVYLNKGVVVKSHAGYNYTSDGKSIAVINQLAKHAHIPLQYFSNRSDKPSGSTLGALLQSYLPITSVDIGCPQLAMHSSYETAGIKDTKYLIKLCKVFYSSDIYLKDKVGITYDSSD